jgi:ABC-2 type transport system permease protein
MLPQFFLAGVFNPIHDLPPFLALLSALTPLRYAVELMRNVYYGTQPALPPPDMTPAPVNLLVIAISGVAFAVLGTRQFVRTERNR